MEVTICSKSGHEICWDGRVVWVNNATDGSSIGRFTRIHAEVHLSASKQVETGTECLDCFDDTSLGGWERFKASIAKHYGAEVPDEAMPDYLKWSPHRVREARARRRHATRLKRTRSYQDD